jgi:hypothetical protein
MSGIYSRSQYDQCYLNEYKKINDTQTDYALFKDYNINPNMKANMNICVHNYGYINNCFLCNNNKEATLDNNPENFKKITEIENNLKGINRPLTYCNDKKFQGCFDNNSNLDECTNNIVINPYLCDRDIIPTNMKRFE